ncbi:MAG: 4Fe-4S dicluster domain-containing protein [Candidatus Odinarchaeia archaeon]
MAKGKIKLLKEAIRSSKDIQTLDYPGGDPSRDYKQPHFGKGSKYSQVVDELRGAPTYDEDKCCGCGACESVCSAGTIKIEDVGNKRILTIDIGRCVFCARCQQECPEDEAIYLTTNFELAYSGPAASNPHNVRLERDLILCSDCGSVVAPVKQYEIYTDKVLEKLTDEWKEQSKKDIEKAKNLCRDCRRKYSFKFDLHTRKYY